MKTTSGFQPGIDNIRQKHSEGPDRIAALTTCAMLCCLDSFDVSDAVVKPSTADTVSSKQTMLKHRRTGLHKNAFGKAMLLSMQQCF